MKHRPGGTRGVLIDRERVEFRIAAAEIEISAADDRRGSNNISRGINALLHAPGRHGINLVVVVTDVDRAVCADGGGGSPELIARREIPFLGAVAVDGIQLVI